jgi:hypothetical protein
MSAVDITSVTGWIAFGLIGLEVLLPYLLRRNRLSSWLGTAKIGTGTPYLRRMWPHYWLGYVLLLLNLIHSVVPLQASELRGMNMLGLWLASGGFLFLLLTIGDRVVAPGPSSVGTRNNAKLALLADVRRRHYGWRPCVAERVVDRIGI